MPHPSSLLAGLLLLALPPVARCADSSDIYRSVVRVEVASQTPDYHTPWNSGRFGGGIGTGFLIGPNKFLTNAHVVSNARRILVTVHGSAKRYPAKVEHIAHDCDLALLSVEGFDDFRNFPVFSFGEVPKLESQVRVIGYPIGGERLSVTRGVVSRIDFQPYSHSRADSHLVVQIDAAINPGNSGGPVVQDGKVVGVAFQGLRQADNTGYIIPVPVIRRFLKDVGDGRYDQYVDLGFTDFPLFNPAMRRALGLRDDNRGVLVAKVTPEGPSDGVLQPGDVITSIDDHAVDSAGMVSVDGETVTMHEIVERKFAGDKVRLRFLRDGTWIDAEVTLKTVPAARMFVIQYEKKPRYLVFAGLVFQPLDTNLYAVNRLENIHVRRMYDDYLAEGLFKKHEDIVILTRVEEDPLTSRLGNFAGLVVEKINGVEVKSLRHAAELLQAEPKPEFLVIECLGAERPIVLPGDQVQAANERVATNYGINRNFNLEE
jgi:S1-C subfamily serine protease